MKRTLFFTSFLALFFYGGLTINAQDNYTDNKSINALLKKKREYNKYNGSGYRIQLYNGVEKRARNIRSSFQQQYPGVYSSLKYDQPEWKVQVGSYRTRLDAERALNRIKEKFSGGMIIEK